MINERIQAGANVARMMMGGFGRFMRAPEEGAANVGEVLRSFAIASLEAAGPERTLRWLWEESRWMTPSFRDDPSGRRLLLEVLSDSDIFRSRDAQVVRDWVLEELLPEAFERPEMLEFIERAWMVEYTPSLGQKLWRAALSTSDYPLAAAQLLMQRVPPQSAVYLDVIGDRGVSQAAASVFAGSLSDDALVEAMTALQQAFDGTAGQSLENRSPARGVALEHLLVLTLEHVKRFGPEEKVIKALFQRLDDYSSHRSPVTKKAAAELARMALTVGAADAPAVARGVVTGGHQYLSVEELAALLKAGMSHTAYGHDRMYLLSEVEASKRQAVADAMTPEQKAEYLSGGFRFVVGNAVHGRQGSLVDEDMLNFLHAAGFELGRADYETNTSEPRWLHECLVDARLQRFTFAKLHLLGVLPKDLQFEGHGPLNYAAYRDDVKAIDAFVKAGYDLEAKSSSKAAPMEEWRRSEAGLTPLLIAAKYERDAAAKRLMQLGADVAAKTDSGMSVAQVGKSEEIKRMVKAVKAGQTLDDEPGRGALQDGGPTGKMSDPGLR